MYLFFDIDGTLLDGKGYIPESTIEGIRLARANGHKAFLCSGRTAGMVPQKVLNIGFDGLVAGAGTYVAVKHDDVECDRADYVTGEGVEVLLNRELTKDELDTAFEWLHKTHQAGFVFEGHYGMHVLPFEQYGEAERYRAYIEHIGAKVDYIDEKNYRDIHTSKFSGDLYAEYEEELWNAEEAMNKKFGLIFHCIVGSRKGETPVPGRGLMLYECLPYGISKGSGMKLLLEHFCADRDEFFAFGDSNNDLEMLEFAGHAICMGNGTEKPKEVAEYITGQCDEDGIWEALKHYGLI